MSLPQKSSSDLFPIDKSPKMVQILPNMYQTITTTDAKTRSIDLARKIVLELADSEARTKDGDICVGKDEILKITNKRRLYDVTGPLEAMGLIQTTKINIIWTGCKLGAFSFIPHTARNYGQHGRNYEELLKFGKRNDLTFPKPVKTFDVNIPKLPKKKRVDSDVKDKLRFLVKRRNLLTAELHEKEAQIYTKKPFCITYNDICIGVQMMIQQMQASQQSDNYTKAFPELQTTVPNLFIISGDHNYQILETQKFVIKSNVDKPRLQEKVVFEFSAVNKQLEVHYIDNNNVATISPNLAPPTMLRSSDNNFTSPPFGVRSGAGFFETPMLNELKYGEWDQDQQ